MENLPLKHPEAELEAQTWLENLGCVPHPLIRAARHHLLTTTLIGVAAIVTLLWCVGPRLEQRHPQVDLGNAIIAVGLVAAAVQWHASLEQQAMEKYEREIAAMNDVSGVGSVRGMMKHHYPLQPGEAAPDYGRAAYVYVQLDNLEYALERYMQGLAPAYTTSRAVMTFANRCLSEEFRSRAAKQLPAASYSPVVHRVVKNVIAKFPKSTSSPS